MDPVSFGASIIAVLQLTSVVIKLVHDVAGASDERSQIMRELSSTSGILYALNDLGDQAQWTGSWTLTVKSLTVPNGPLDQFKEALELLAKELAPIAKLKKAATALKWPFKKSQVTDLLAKIERQKTLFALALQNDHMALSQAIQSQVDAISRDVAALRVVQRDQRDIDILRWLSTLEPRSRRADLSKQRQAGTGQWLLEQSSFQDWVDGQSKTLFCPGIPGAGKTILTLTVIQHLLDCYYRDDEVAVVFAFCDYRDPESQSPIQVFSSLLEQLLQRRASVPHNVQDLYDQHNKRGTRPTLDEILVLLEKEISDLKRVFVVIDAADECTDDHKARQTMLTKLRELQQYGQVCLLVTSRFIPEIELHFRNAERMEIRATAADIRLYVQGQLSRLAVKVSGELAEAIENGIIETADGMFLLARLHFDSLADKNAKGIRMALKTLSKGSNTLNAAYDGAMARIDAQSEGSRSLAQRSLMWVTFARRALRVNELQYALAIEPDTSEFDEENIDSIERITSVCMGLLDVDRQSNDARLVHYTTQAYLEDSQRHRFANAHADLARSCLTCLNYDALGLEIRELWNSPLWRPRTARIKLQGTFLLYAVRSWTLHYRQSSDPTNEALVMQLLQDPEKTAFCTSIQYNLSKKYARSRTAIYLCAAEGLTEIMAKLLALGMLPTPQARGIELPLQVAAEKGNTATVRLLLDRKDNCIRNATLRGKLSLVPAARGGGTILITACVHLGQQALVEYLLGRGDIDVNAKDPDGLTALHCTAANPEIMRLLLAQPSIDVNPRNGMGWTPLVRVCDLSGYYSTVRASLEILLSRADVDVTVLDNRGRTTLMVAARTGGDPIVVKQLLAHPNTDINRRTDTQGTALSYALAYNRVDMARILLEQPDLDPAWKDRANPNNALTLAEDYLAKDRWNPKPISERMMDLLRVYGFPQQVEEGPLDPTNSLLPSGPHGLAHRPTLDRNWT